MVDLAKEVDSRSAAGLQFRGPSPVKAAASFRSALESVKAILLEEHVDLLRRSVTDMEQKFHLHQVIETIVDTRAYSVAGYSRQALINGLVDEIAGLSVLEPLLRDPEITDIFVNAPNRIFIEKNGRRERVDITFPSANELLNVIGRIADRIGRKVNETDPLLDARLPDGSRVNAVIPPVALSAPRLTIRKHTSKGFTVQKFLDRGFLSNEMAEFLGAAVRGRLNLVVAGGTSVGKTTTLRMLASFIPSEERVITVEDTEELRLYEFLSNCVASEATHTKDMYSLVVNSLRENPDRLIVGEVRHKEGWALIEAMATGHDGSMTTVHASSASAAIKRLVRILLRAGMNIDAAQLEDQVVHSVDLICFVRKTIGGIRRMVAIVEVSPSGLRLLYRWNHLEERFEAGNSLSPEKIRKMSEHGINFASNHHPEAYSDV